MYCDWQAKAPLARRKDEQKTIHFFLWINETDNKGERHSTEVTPSREYLFDPANNVELGTAYLNVLMFNQLEAVDHDVSREYCVIAAYNTGPSNVFRAFSRDRTTAVNQINSLQPAGVYNQLRKKLPYEETRNYLEKVTGYRKSFVSATGQSN